LDIPDPHDLATALDNVYAKTEMQKTARATATQLRQRYDWDTVLDGVATDLECIKT
jgi:hypothetical protein